MLVLRMEGASEGCQEAKDEGREMIGKTYDGDGPSSNVIA